MTFEAVAHGGGQEHGLLDRAEHVDFVKQIFYIHMIMIHASFSRRRGTRPNWGSLKIKLKRRYMVKFREFPFPFLFSVSESGNSAPSSSPFFPSATVCYFVESATSDLDFGLETASKCTFDPPPIPRPLQSSAADQVWGPLAQQWECQP